MPKWETVKAGDRLWDVHRETMGNTTMRRWGSWPVDVIEINHEEGWAMCRWNHNPPRRVYRRAVEKYRRSPRSEHGPTSFQRGLGVRTNGVGSESPGDASDGECDDE